MTALRTRLCNCAELALSREVAAGRTPDPLSVAAVEVARRYARGEATEKELSSARAGAWGAVCRAASGSKWVTDEVEAAIAATLAWQAVDIAYIVGEVQL